MHWSKTKIVHTKLILRGTAAMSVFHNQHFCELFEKLVQDSFRFYLNINMGLIIWVYGCAVIIENNPEKAEITDSWSDGRDTGMQ